MDAIDLDGLIELVRTKIMCEKEAFQNHFPIPDELLLGAVASLQHESGDGARTLAVAKRMGKTTQKEVNPRLYKLQEQGLVVKVQESPSVWEITEKGASLVAQPGGKTIGSSTSSASDPDAAIPPPPSSPQQPSIETEQQVHQSYQQYKGWSEQYWYRELVVTELEEKHPELLKKEVQRLLQVKKELSATIAKRASELAEMQEDAAERRVRSRTLSTDFDGLDLVGAADTAKPAALASTVSTAWQAERVQDSMPRQQGALEGDGFQAGAVDGSAARLRTAPAAAGGGSEIEGLEPHSEALRPYQQWMHDQATQNDGNAVIKLPTGQGKTRVAFEVISTALQRHPGRAVVFLCPNVNLCTQQCLYFEAFLQTANALSPARIRVVQAAGTSGKTGKDVLRRLGSRDSAAAARECSGLVVFATAGTFSDLIRGGREFADEERNAAVCSTVFSRMALLVFDECHHSVRMKSASKSGVADHDYANIARLYREQSPAARPKLLGLTGERHRCDRA